jgi:hypothetical protein
MYGGAAMLLGRTLNGAVFNQSFVDQDMKLPCIAITLVRVRLGIGIGAMLV